MKRKSLKKSKISIQKIGKQRFWFGVIAGLTSAIALSLIFNKMRESIRFFVSISTELLIFEKDELQFFNYFFAALATVLGLSICIWIWMGNSIDQRKRHRLYKLQSRTNSLFSFWFIMFLIGQFCCFCLFCVFGQLYMDDLNFNLYKDHAVLFILIPIVIFAQSWFFVRMVYRAEKWMFSSLLIVIISTFTLYNTTSSNPKKVSQLYWKKYLKSYQYVDKVTTIAKKNYGITYDSLTIKTLKQPRTNKSIQQVSNIKRAFSSGRKIPLDTIILQKIIIHNSKENNSNWSSFPSDPIKYWNYPLPNNILKQINFYKSNTSETKELFNVLQEMILYVNKAKIKKDINKYAFYDDGYLFDASFIKKTQNVCDSLKKQDRYADLSKTLPTIKNIE